MAILLKGFANLKDSRILTYLSMHCKAFHIDENPPGRTQISKLFLCVRKKIRLCSKGPPTDGDPRRPDPPDGSFRRPCYSRSEACFEGAGKRPLADVGAACAAQPTLLP